MIILAHTSFKYSHTTRQETQVFFINNDTSGAMLDNLLPRSQTLSKLASERRRKAAWFWKEPSSQVFSSYKPSIFFCFFTTAHSQRAVTGLSQNCVHL